MARQLDFTERAGDDPQQEGAENTHPFKDGEIVHSRVPVICGYFADYPHPERPGRILSTNSHLVQGTVYALNHYRFAVAVKRPDGNDELLWNCRRDEWERGPRVHTRDTRMRRVIDLG